MKRRSSFMRGWSFAVAFALALTQVALAAHACRMDAIEMAKAMHAAPQMQMSEDCQEGMAPETLCIKTCQDEPQKYEAVFLAALPPAPDAGLRVETLYLARAASPPIVESNLARATSPPATLLFARFLK